MPGRKKRAGQRNACKTSWADSQIPRCKQRGIKFVALQSAVDHDDSAVSSYADELSSVTAADAVEEEGETHSDDSVKADGDSELTICARCTPPILDVARCAVGS